MAYHKSQPLWCRRWLSMSTKIPSESSNDNEPYSSTSSIFPLHILGCGSIGLLYASAIHSAYCNRQRERSGLAIHDDNDLYPAVTLLMRAHHKPHLLRRTDSKFRYYQPANATKWHQYIAPVTIHKGGKTNHHAIPVELIENDDATSTQCGPPIKCILLCTKATEAVAALDSIWHRIQTVDTSSSPVKVIILSNGALGVRNAIYNHFGKKQDGRMQIILGTTTHGAYNSTSSDTNHDDGTNYYNITHAGEGSTHCTDAEFIHTCSQSSGFHDSATLSEIDMNIMLWKKLAVNCVINPLTAVADVTNGQLLDIKLHIMGQDMKVMIRKLLDEVSRVALLEMEAEQSDIQPSVKEQLSVSSLEQFVYKVMTDTSNNVSSMLQDIRANRTTEIDFLNGYVASIGKEKYRLECPANIEMCRLVKEKSSC